MKNIAPNTPTKSGMMVGLRETKEEISLAKGFKHCKSGPLVRPSYHADEQVSAASA